MGFLVTKSIVPPRPGYEKILSSSFKRPRRAAASWHLFTGYVIFQTKLRNATFRTCIYTYVTDKQLLVIIYRCYHYFNFYYYCYYYFNFYYYSYCFNHYCYCYVSEFIITFILYIFYINKAIYVALILFTYRLLNIYI